MTIEQQLLIAFEESSDPEEIEERIKLMIRLANPF